MTVEWYYIVIGILWIANAGGLLVGLTVVASEPPSFIMAVLVLIFGPFIGLIMLSAFLWPLPRERR